MEKPILQLEALSKFYTSTQNVVVGLNRVSISFSRGEFVAITGESGSGKSTLAHILGGMLGYESGEMYFGGRPTSHFDARDWERYRRDNISFISQSYGILLSATVLENVVSALRLAGMDKGQARQEAKTILQKVELWELRRRRAAKLSSGQKQRLSIARALAKPAPILIADEPTGNLDPENSAKIIDLLAQAAKTKLVLLITHDFAEAEGCATRRISLQDGVITMDAPLREPNIPEDLSTPPVKRKEPLSFYAARLQLTGRPIWGSFVLLFFALTAFAVFAFLGTLIVNLDDSGTRIYDDEAFRNGDQTRLVVQRIDGQPMTQADYDALLGIRYVASLDRHSYIRDINCFYQEGIDHRKTFKMVNFGTSVDTNYQQVEALEFLQYTNFAQTVPLMPEGKTFLTAGREPENIFEVVVVGDESRIGETISYHLTDSKNWGLGYHFSMEATVVGVTDYGEGVYVHEDLGRAFSYTVAGSVLFAPLSEGQKAEFGALEGNTCRFYANSFYNDGQFYSGTHYMGDVGVFYVTLGGVENVEVEGFHKLNCPYLIQVSDTLFRQLMDQANTNQVSLTIENYAYTDRVLRAAQSMGYLAVSPYQLGSTIQISELVTQRLQTLLICAAVLLAVLALQILVLRALFGSEIENYRLLANIGLTCATAKRSVLWQVLLFTALGQGVGFAGLLYCNHIGIERIVSIMRYLPAELMAVLSAVHLAAAVAAALVIGGAVRKRIYPLVKKQDDIRLDEEVAV